jgi:hypothetical protein
VFRNYDRPDSTKDNEWYFNTGDASVAKVWKVARATSAAPLYFSKQSIGNSTYLDGGMGCNNPAELMSHEIKGVHGREPDLILSIGTGAKPRAENESGEQRKTRKHKLLDNARSVLHAAKRLPDLATESEKFHLRLKSNLNSLRTRGNSKYPMYFRFNVPDLGTMELDAWKSSEHSKKPDGQHTLRELQNHTEVSQRRIGGKGPRSLCKRASSYPQGASQDGALGTVRNSHNVLLSREGWARVRVFAFH